MRRRGLVIVILVVGLLISGTSVIVLLLPGETVDGELALEAVQDGLAFPVSFVPAEDGRIFYNELQRGNVRIIEGGRLLEQPFVTLEVVTLAETGLLGLALNPSFAADPYVYLYYTYDSGEGIFNRISRFKDLGNVAGPEEILMDFIPASSIHNSGRLLFGPDGKLYASVGDSREREQAQVPASLRGKILRMNPDGSLPEDNPFGDSYAYVIGIRNVFGMDFTPGGLLLFTDNGPAGNDEVNRGQPGLNYGWPDVQGKAQGAVFEDPILVFTPSIAPTGLAFYTGTALGVTRTNAAFFGSWNEGTLRRVIGDVEGGEGNFTSVVELVVGRRGILDVANGPDEKLYVSTPDGIFQVVLQESPEGDQSSSPGQLPSVYSSAYALPPLRWNPSRPLRTWGGV